MHLSKRKVNQYLETHIKNSLFQLIADIKNPSDAKIIFSDIFTNTELTIFAKRLAVAYYLKNERDYKNIANNLKVSSTTIAKVTKTMKGKGFQMALKGISTDEWANKWSRKIKKAFKVG